MQPLGDSDILAVWETAQRYHPVDQALALLRMAAPELSRDALGALPLGRRDARLLTLRQATFGDTLNSRANCPHCNETVEFDVTCSALHVPDPVMAERTFTAGGYRLRVRPLGSIDFAAAAGAGDSAAAYRLLLRRCVVEARHDDALVDADALPEAVGAAAAQAAHELDPQAELLFALACPACGERWQAILDIAHILWQEVQARARRLLMEVHLLARAYGWREVDILAMSTVRRQAYVQQVAA